MKHYPLSILCVMAVWVLSLTPFFPETPLDDVKFIDKWTHLVMYGGTTLVIWLEHLRLCHRRRQDADNRTLSGIVMPLLVAMGGLLEVLQATCTSTRNGDVVDFLANMLGVLLGGLAGQLVGRMRNID